MKQGKKKEEHPMVETTKATFIIITITILIGSLHLVSSAKSCKDYKFSNNRHFRSCTDLPVLGATLHWSYLPTAKTARIAYRGPQTPKGWVAWGINPITIGMVGTQALVAFHDSNNGRITVYSTPINSYYPSMKPGRLSFRVSGLSAEYVKGEMIIFAVVGPLRSKTTEVNIVWQAGDSVSNNIPQPHTPAGENAESMVTLDLVSGRIYERENIAIP